MYKSFEYREARKIKDDIITELKRNLVVKAVWYFSEIVDGVIFVTPMYCKFKLNV